MGMFTPDTVVESEAVGAGERYCFRISKLVWEMPGRPLSVW